MIESIIKMDTVDFIIKLGAIAIFILIIVFAVNRILRGLAKAVDEADIKKVGIGGVEFDTKPKKTIFKRKSNAHRN